MKYDNSEFQVKLRKLTVEDSYNWLLNNTAIFQSLNEDDRQRIAKEHHAGLMKLAKEQKNG